MINITNQVVSCNECEADFTLPKPKRKVHKDLIYEFYFHCPKCERKYVSYYTDKKIRRDIKRQEKRWARYRVAGTEASERKLHAEINMQDKLIKKDMDALKERMQKDVV